MLSTASPTLPPLEEAGSDARMDNYTKETLLTRWTSVESDPAVLEALRRNDDFPSMDQRYGLHPTIDMELDEEGVTIGDKFVERLLHKAEYALTESKFDPAEDPCVTATADDIPFEITPVQRFVASFMHPRTPYNGVLLYHGVGVGKTCAAIQAAEAFLDQYPNSKVMIVAPKNIQAGFLRTIFDSSRIKVGDGTVPNQSFQCTGDTYLKLGGTTFETDKAVIERLASKAIRSRYELFGYVQFANKIKTLLAQAQKMRLPPGMTLAQLEAQLLREEFGYRMLIIDEAHNIRDVGIEESEEEDLDTGKEDAESEKAGKLLTPYLRRLVSDVDGMKLMLMTATPMFNSVREIVFLMNLLLKNDKKASISEAQLFNKDNTLKEGAKGILGPLANAYVSFMRGENPNSFPVRLFPEEGRVTAENYPRVSFNPKDAINEGGEDGEEGEEDEGDAAEVSKLPLVLSKFVEGSAEEKAYEKINELIKERDGYGYSALNILVQAGNAIFPTLGMVEDSSADSSEESSQEGGSLEARIGAQGFNAIFERKKDQFTPRTGSVSWLRLGELERYSPKIASIMQSIRKSEGVSFVYSRFVKAGALLMAFVLEAHGYTPYGREKRFVNHPDIGYGGRACALCDRRERDHGGETEHGHKFTAATYILLTGDQELSPRNAAAIAAEREPANADGSIIKVVLGSQIAGEGLDLKFVRDVHILDAWFHLNKTEQIIGRGIRFLSHCALPAEKRNTTVHLHVVGSSDSGKGGSESADLYSYRSSLRKAILIGTVSRILKAYAVDCNLRSGATVLQGLPGRTLKDSLGHIRRNVEVNDTPFTALCDWLSNCNYKCRPKNPVVKTDLDYSSYSSFHAHYMETELKNHIRDLFSQQTLYSQEDFIKALESATDFSKIAIAYVLRSIINDRTFVVKHGELEGYVIYRNTYYVFQPFIYQSTAIPLALRNAELPLKRDEFTAKELAKGEIKTFQRYSTLNWGIVSGWIDRLEAGEITNEKPTGRIVGVIQEYTTDPETGIENLNLRKSLMDKIQMIIHFMNALPDEYKEVGAGAVRAYFWDTWLSKEQQLALMKTHTNDEAGSQNQFTSGSQLIYRFVNPKNGTIEYVCKNGTERCSSAVVELLEKDKTDRLRMDAVGSAYTGRVVAGRSIADLYGFVIYKKGEFKFKIVSEPANPKNEKKPARGIMPDIISQSNVIDRYMEQLDGLVKEHVDGLDLRFYRKVQKGYYESNAQKSVLIELQLRLLEALEAGQFRWFYRPLEAIYSGHVGERELTEAKIPKKGAVGAEEVTGVKKRAAPGTSVRAQLIPLQRPAAVEKRSRAPTSPEEEENIPVVPQKPKASKRKINMSKVPLKAPPPLKKTSMYFEHQEGVLCGKHALNNLLGSEVYTKVELNKLCKTISARIKPSSPLCDKNGFYSHEVLEEALKGKGYDVQDIISYEAGQEFYAENSGKYAGRTGSAANPLYREITLDMVLRKGLTIENFLGILIVNGGHWIAIKKDAHGYLWLDSMYDAPDEARDRIIDVRVEGELDVQVEAMIEKAREFDHGMNNRMMAVYRGEAYDFFPDVRAFQPVEAAVKTAATAATAAIPKTKPVAPPPLKSILKKPLPPPPIGSKGLEPNDVLEKGKTIPKKNGASKLPSPPQNAKPMAAGNVLKKKKGVVIKNTPEIKEISPLKKVEENYIPSEEVIEEEEDGSITPPSPEENENEGISPPSMINENEDESISPPSIANENQDEGIRPPPASVTTKKSIMAMLENDEEEAKPTPPPVAPKPVATKKSIMAMLENDEEEPVPKPPAVAPKPIVPKKSIIAMLENDEEESAPKPPPVAPKPAAKKPSAPPPAAKRKTFLSTLLNDDE